LEKQFNTIVYYHALTKFYYSKIRGNPVLSEDIINRNFSKYAQLTRIEKDVICSSSDIGYETYYIDQGEYKSTLGVPLEQLRQRDARIYGRLLLGWMQEMRQIVSVQTEYNRSV